MDYKADILEIIKLIPKHYSKFIKLEPELHDWVMPNSKAKSDKFLDHIFSAIKQESNICPYGNIKHYCRDNKGWKNCGKALGCKCTSDDISHSISQIKSSYSDDKKARIQIAKET